MRTSNIMLCAAAVCDHPERSRCSIIYGGGYILYLLTGGYIYTLKIYERRKKQQTNNHHRIVEIYIYIHIYNLSIMACVSCVIYLRARAKNSTDVGRSPRFIHFIIIIIIAYDVQHARRRITILFQPSSNGYYYY